jgi:putative phage-type endonuclease
MKMTNIEIGSQAWLDMRLNYITATDAASIMGRSPYETALERYESKKTGKQKPKNAAMQRGIDLEPEARMIYEQHTGNMVQPAWRVHKAIKWMAATFDGINDKGVGCEIKCPGLSDHLVAISGKLPDKYFCQLQHQMAVEEWDGMDYWSFRPEHDIPYKLLQIEADHKFRAEMIEREEEFFYCLKNNIPPKPSAKDIVSRRDFSWLDKEAELFNLIEKRKNLEAQEDVLRKEIIKMCDGQGSKGHHLKVVPVETEGRVQYDNIPELKGIDLDAYRNPKTISWRITDV